MKKSFAVMLGLGLSLLISSVAIAKATSGCMGLIGSQWKGQAKLINGHMLAIAIRIDDVIDRGGVFDFKGLVNNEKIDGILGCIEDKPGQIASVAFDNNKNGTIMGMILKPNGVNPTRIEGLAGRWKKVSIDTTSAPSKNFLNISH